MAGGVVDGNAQAVSLIVVSAFVAGHFEWGHDYSLRLYARECKAKLRRGEMLLTMASAQWQTKDMKRTNAEWFERAVKHLEIVQGLLDGSIGREEFWNKGMTVAEAVAVERHNVAYCLGQIG